MIQGGSDWTSLNSLEDVEDWRNLDNRALTTGWDKTLGGEDIGEEGGAFILSYLYATVFCTRKALKWSLYLALLSILSH